MFTVFRMLSITISRVPSLTLKAVGYGECVLCVGVKSVCHRFSPVMEAMQAGARGLCH